MSNVNTGLGLKHDNEMNHHIDNKALLTAHSAKLDSIVSNTANIKASIEVGGDLYVSQDGVEALLTTIDGVLDNILVKNGEIETSADALIAANHTDLVALEASLTSMETKQDTVIGHVDGIETLITATNSAIATFDAVLDASLVKQTAIATDVANIETLITSTNALISTLDGVQDNALTKLTEIDTAIDTLDAVVDAVLVKLAPVKSHTTTHSSEIAASQESLSSAIDVRTVKHINIAGSNTNMVQGTLNVFASTTSNGTYQKVAIGTFFENELTIGSFPNIAYKYLKIGVVNGASASTYNVVVYMSS